MVASCVQDLTFSEPPCPLGLSILRCVHNIGTGSSGYADERGGSRPYLGYVEDAMIDSSGGNKLLFHNTSRQLMPSSFLLPTFLPIRFPSPSLDPSQISTASRVFTT